MDRLRVETESQLRVVGHAPSNVSPIRCLRVCPYRTHETPAETAAGGCAERLGPHVGELLPEIFATHAEAAAAADRVLARTLAAGDTSH